jgi:hypothetical protein
MSTANTSTNMVDDLGVPVSGGMANAGALDNNASAPAAPVQLQREMRVANDGNESVRRVQQRVGNFETVTLDENSMRERLVEGVDDAVICRPAQRQRTSQQNGTRRRNRHDHDPSAEMNFPNLRYFNVSNAFQHLGSLTDAVAQAFVNPPPLPPHTMSDIMDDFTRASDQLYVDEQRNFVMGITFWTNVLNNLILGEQANLAAIGVGKISPTKQWQQQVEYFSFIYLQADRGFAAVAFWGGEESVRFCLKKG